MLQPGPVDHGHAGEQTVKVIGVTLRHGQRLAAAFRRSHEIEFCRRAAIGAHHQGDRGVAHFLVGAMCKILERFVVERKQLRRLARLVLVAGVGAVGDEAARQRRGRSERRGRRQAKARYQHAIKTAAAILQRAAVPLDGQVDLEADRRRLGIGRLDAADDLAEFRIGRLMRAAGVGARSATASGDGACMAAESMWTALSVSPASPLQVATGSPVILEAASTAVDDIIAASKNAHTPASIEASSSFPPNSVLWSWPPSLAAILETSSLVGWPKRSVPTFTSTMPRRQGGGLALAFAHPTISAQAAPQLVTLLLPCVISRAGRWSRR